MTLAQLFADASGQHFAWRDSALLDILGHQAARGLPVLGGAVAIAGGFAGFAVQALRPWTRIPMLTIGAAMLVGSLVVNVLKGMTTQQCPTAMQAFGGVVDYAVEQQGPFWATSAQDAGHCLPSGHAAGGYALLSLYFAGWAAGRPAWRWRGLAIGIATGLVFSAGRALASRRAVHERDALGRRDRLDRLRCRLLSAAMFSDNAQPLWPRHARRRSASAASVLSRARVGCALAVFVWLAFSIGLHPLTLPDEGRYVGVAWEMLRSGDWLTPTVNSLPFFHKPPLFYWLTAASMHVFGVGPASARAASLLAACVALVGDSTSSTRRRAGAGRRRCRRRRPGDHAALLRRRPVRQPRPSGRGMHRARDRVPRRGRRDRRQPRRAAPPLARRRLGVGGARSVLAKGSIGTRHARGS